MRKPEQLNTVESPRQIIREDFKIDLPISGGWGYNLETSCVIDKNDSTVSKVIPFNGIQVEYIFIEKRIYEEMIIFRDKHERFAGIRWNQNSQLLKIIDNKYYDVLSYSIEGFSKDIWLELTNRFKEIQESGKIEMMDELNAYRESQIYRFTSDFYFDISSFYGESF